MKWGILVVLGLTVSIALAFTMVMSPDGRRDQKLSLPQLAQQAGVSFPPQARLLGAHRERGIDEYLAFKVELPESALQTFTKTLPFSNQDGQPGVKAAFGPDQGFFDPSNAVFQVFYEGRVAERELKLGITSAQNGWVTVYVVSFQT